MDPAHFSRLEDLARTIRISITYRQPPRWSRMVRFPSQKEVM
jgi:hypothetical protein